LEWNTARLILMFTDFAHYKTSRFKDVFILYLLITLKWMLFKKAKSLSRRQSSI